MFYVLYPFVTFLLPVSRISLSGKPDSIAKASVGLTEKHF
jgi:hypothetical protein